MGLILPFLVQGNIDDHKLAVTAETAKEAFAKAIEWQAVQFADVSISDGTKSFTLTEFASFMALKAVADTIDTSAEVRRNAKS
jgi:3-oxoacyl-(acyl-carrier-protein) synthase